ncbi:BAH_G0046620.mRNA.1.CDS.1 [Saccharomyces cerevisiae]|nr:BAH_G0046620.mRNA.1.CDS.1 [Saccharomyces cerevisiae]CAI7298431.1 BAH_G0046620.mRNA.1.CDS.1 [Saccharomyces cerevisiae]
MVLRIRRIKKLAPLIFTSLLSLIVLFRVYRQYPFSDHFETRREDDHSGNLHCFSRLRQIEEYEKPELTSKFYEPNRWKSFISYVTRGRKDVKTVSRSLSNLDLYQKCSKEIRADQDISLLHSIETKLFPYINFTALNSEQSHNFWPVHTRFDGTKYSGQVLQFSSENNSFIGTSPIEFKASEPFWENWLNSALQRNSKGVVMSVSDYLVADTIRLIRVLRLLNNSLPIEIVHKSDLHESSQQLLIAAAREPGSLNYPPQELWFLDVKDMLNDEYLARFKRFSNKWLAITFCSFQIPIFLDSDTVPFVPLDTLYEIDGFKRTGTLFFKDRSFPTSKLSPLQVKVLKQIINNSLDVSSDSEQGFEILKHNLNDEMAIDAIEALIFKKQKHYMDSGLVIFDKQKHFFCLPIAIMLQFSPIQEFFHGDKEWFWLSLFISKKEFTFYPVEASNVGRLEKPETLESSTICSTQLSHTDVYGNILWLNGGLSVCKKNCWNYDFTKRKEIAAKYKSVDELRNYYQSPVKLEAVIIPDVSKSPWSQQSECVMYSYCTHYRKGQYGKLIEFTDSQKKYYEKVVELWNKVV